MKRAIIFAMILLGLLTVRVNAEMGIYLDSAGYLVNYKFPSGKTLGVRYNKGGNFSICGVNFKNPIEKLSSKSIRIYWGLEGDYILSFKGENSKGNGAIIYFPIGAICSLGRINFIAEIGPGVIYLKDKATGIKVTEFDPTIYNVGIGFRF